MHTEYLLVIYLTSSDERILVCVCVVKVIKLINLIKDTHQYAMVLTKINFKVRIYCVWLSISADESLSVYMVGDNSSGSLSLRHTVGYISLFGLTHTKRSSPRVGPRMEYYFGAIIPTWILSSKEPHTICHLMSLENYYRIVSNEYRSKAHLLSKSLYITYRIMA